MTSQNPDSIDNVLKSMGLKVEKEPQPSLPSQQVPLEMALSAAFDSKEGYLLLYHQANEQKVQFPTVFLKPSYSSYRGKVTVQHPDLEALFKECETELEHRGFRSDPPQYQNDGAGFLIARIFRFNDTSGRFETELGQLMQHFDNKYNKP